MRGKAAPIFASGPDELLTPDELGRISGLEFLERIRDGLLPQPPIGRILGFHLAEVSLGRVVFEGEAAFDVYNPLGAVHGGWFGALLDSCMSCAVQSRLPVGQGYTTLEFKTGLIRPVTVDTGQVRAIGEAVHVGRRTGVAEGRIVSRKGKLIATGTATCLILDLSGAAAS